MKYLKQYKIFESSIDDTYSDIKDVFQELIDEYSMEENSKLDDFGDGYFYSFNGLLINPFYQTEFYTPGMHPDKDNDVFSIWFEPCDIHKMGIKKEWINKAIILSNRLRRMGYDISVISDYENECIDIKINRI